MLDVLVVGRMSCNGCNLDFVCRVGVSDFPTSPQLQGLSRSDSEDWVLLDAKSAPPNTSLSGGE